MFSDFLSYIVIPTMISLGTFGLYYIMNPEKGNNIITNIAWQSVSLYSKANIYLEQMTKTDIEFVEVKKNITDPSLSYYNYNKGLEVKMGNDYKDLPNEWWKDSEQNIDLVILKNHDGDKLYKTFTDVEKFNKYAKNKFKSTSKQFVQVELIQGEDCIDIHNHLDRFYVKNNVIFTPAFLKWYLKRWFNKSLKDDTYIIRIFDKDVNLFNLTSKEYIKITSDGYKIKNINDDDTSDSESSDSNASDKDTDDNSSDSDTGDSDTCDSDTGDSVTGDSDTGDSVTGDSDTCKS